jgi:hypothetical protein
MIASAGLSRGPWCALCRCGRAPQVGGLAGLSEALLPVGISDSCMHVLGCGDIGMRPVRQLVCDVDAAVYVTDYAALHMLVAAA